MYRTYIEYLQKPNCFISLARKDCLLFPTVS
nr:MAG TPA: hypothetical protein [Caudoviricetes sp.]